MACEFSGVVREAFRDRGHEAYSCDIMPSDDNSKYHIQDDVLQHLDEDWDILIAHPPCTYLCNSGVAWLHKEEGRMKLMDHGAKFFKTLKDSNIEKICVENPIPHKYAKSIIGRYTQIIQPYEFGHAETKATCLWLKGLPRLIPTNNVKREMDKLPDNIKHRIHHTSPGKDRAKIRSITFQGIAEAMAEQWTKPYSNLLMWSGIQ